MRKFSRNYALRVAAFLFALSASVSLFNHLHGLMSASRLPPGLGAAQHYNALAHGWPADSITSDGTFLYPFISFTMNVFNLDLLTALKLIPTFLLSALPLLAYFLSLTVTGSRLVGVAAAWMLAFMPPVTTPFIVGNYSLILGLFLFTACLSFLVKCLKRGSRAALYLVLLVSAFTLPLSFLLILGSSQGTQGQLVRVNLDTWAENLWLTLSMVVGVAIGVYTLLKRAKTVVLPMLFALGIVPFALVFIPALSLLQAQGLSISKVITTFPFGAVDFTIIPHTFSLRGLGLSSSYILMSTVRPD